VTSCREGAHLGALGAWNITGTFSKESGTNG
jgi:hypothetical protein